ncbi:MAG: AAA family ATPase, partial [Pseudomonadota bacterium]
MERRQLTVLFCDMVGSVEIGANLELEDYRELLTDFRNAITTAISAENGYIARHQGDAVLAYFGYPHASESDSQRAVRAGLRIISAVAPLSPRRGHPIQVRVGIATGPVVVGDVLATASSSESEYAAVGSAPNLAARLQGLANPNELLVSSTTYRLTGSRFDSMPARQLDVKGWQNKVDVFQIIGERTAGYSDYWTRDTTPLIGREPELDKLRQCWAKARAGHGQVMYITGQAGLGKSRILRAFAAHVANENCMVVPLQCSAHRNSNALYPIVDWLNREARIGLTDSAKKYRRKLSALLAPYLHSSYPYAGVVAALLEQCCSTVDTLDLTTTTTLNVSSLAEIAALTAKQQPLLLLIEDYHWADPTFSEFVEAIARRIVNQPVCMVITSRSEDIWSDAEPGSGATMSLPPLTRKQSEALVEQTADGIALDRSVIDTICDRSDGIPLFLEEITRVFQEEIANTEETRELSFSVPERLQDSLMARLDKLGPAKYVAQVCAIMGRRFEKRILEYLVDLSESSLLSSLMMLTRSEIITAVGPADSDTFVFTHVLVQETAYQSLLRRVRADIHGRYAEALVTHFPQVAKTNPDLVAHHFAAAHRHNLAIDHWISAGNRAIARSASPEALQCADNGIELIGKLEEKTDRDRLEIRLRVIQGSAKLMSRGQGSDAVERAYSRALVLAKGAGQEAELFPALLGTWRYYIGSARRDSAFETTTRLDELSQSMNSRAHKIIAKMALANTSFHKGDMHNALKYAQSGIGYGAQGHISDEEAQLFLIGQDPLVSLHFCAAFSACLTGTRTSMDEHINNGIVRARELQQPFTLGMALIWIVILNQITDNREGVKPAAEELVDLSQRHNLLWCYGFGLASSGWVAVKEGKVEEGLHTIEEGIET